MLKSENVREWTQGKFVMNSGFYAGRGPKLSDLNSSLLEMFYKGIKKDAGATIASNFVRFVNKLSDLSASAFIVAFESFIAKGGTVVKIPQRPGDATCVTGHGNTREAQAFAIIAHAMSGTKLLKSQLQLANHRIKGKFILKHYNEIPAKERRKQPFSFSY